MPYVKITDFAAKDTLPSGNPLKIIRGSELGAEFDAIAAADAGNVKTGGPASFTNLTYTGTLTGGTGTINIGSGQLVKDTAGNLGLGVVPSAWGGGIKAFDISGGSVVATANTTEVHNNSYFNGTSSIYKSTGFAAKYTVNANSGAHQWYTAPSGTAGNPITFTQAMTLDASGNLGVGTSTPGSKLDVAAIGFAASQSGGIQIRDASNQWQAKILLNSDAGGSPYITYQFGTQPYIFYNTNPSYLAFSTSNTERARIDSSGNLGLGVVPSAWGASFRAHQIAPLSALVGDNNNGSTYVGSNWYQSGAGAGTATYLSTNRALRYSMNPGAGAHTWETAPSGTAGNPITFTQAASLDATGLAVAGTVTSGGIGLTRSQLFTAVATTSGTAIDFTGIPTWAKRVTVIFDGISTNGASPIIFQLGAGSVQVTGYTSVVVVAGGANNTAAVAYTTGFGIAGGSAADNRYGTMSINSLGLGSVWVCNGENYAPASAVAGVSTGRVTLTGALDRLRITTVNGTDTFDAGSINILVEG